MVVQDERTGHAWANPDGVFGRDERTCGRRAAHPPGEAKQRMGDAYVEMIKDRRKLRMQMQAYAACDDPDVRRIVQRGFKDLAGYIQVATGASSVELAHFLAQGMLLNVMASMDVLGSEEPWAASIREGCMAKAL